MPPYKCDARRKRKEPEVRRTYLLFLGFLRILRIITGIKTLHIERIDLKLDCAILKLY